MVPYVYSTYVYARVDSAVKENKVIKFDRIAL
jgi:hypothetical protein